MEEPQRAWPTLADWRDQNNLLSERLEWATYLAHDRVRDRPNYLRPHCLRSAALTSLRLVHDDEDRTNRHYRLRSFHVVLMSLHNGHCHDGSLRGR